MRPHFAGGCPPPRTLRGGKGVWLGDFGAGLRVTGPHSGIHVPG